MRLFLGRRTLKYIGFPAIVSAGLVWKGTSHYKSSKSWPTEDVLLNVQVFHRHGDRTPATMLRTDRNKENELWANKVSKLYSPLRYNPTNDDTEKFTTNSGIKLDEMYQWKNIANKLNGTYLVHKKDNYDINAPYLVSSKDNDKQTQDILSNMECWDTLYHRRLNRSYWNGQLTDKGVIDMIELGSWLRQRYIDKFAFLSATYQNDTKLTNPTIIIKPSKPKKDKLNKEMPSIYYISTNFARTIHSADALLMGLYPFKNRTNDSSIPIHCDNRSTWLYPNPSCKRWKKKRAENEEKLKEMEDEDMIKLKQKFLDFYGKDKGIWLYLCESIGCRLHHEIDLPPKDIVSDNEMMDFIEYNSLRICKYHGMDRDSLRLTVGVLLNKLVNNMNNLENKFLIYSGHDGTIQRLLVSLSNGKDFKFSWPKYGADLIFEVWEKNIIKDEDKKSFIMSIKDWINGNDKTRRKYVRILYEGNIIYLNGDEFIPINIFKNMWNDLIIDDEAYWDRECVC